MKDRRKGRFAIVALNAALFLQDCQDDHSQRLVLSAWSDAIAGGMVIG